MRLHPWHEIPLGDDAPDEVNLVVEVPRDTTTKYELDPDLGILCVDRIMHPPISYPANYGFLPQTLDEDGDPLDALIIMQNAVAPLTVLTARPIGVVNFVDRGENDDKIICVHGDDPKYEDCSTLDDLSEHQQEVLEWFFEDYKDSMSSDAKVEGFNGRESAYESIRMCRTIYRDEFPNGWEE